MGFAERFRGGVGGPPVFAPRITALAARLEQVDAGRLEQDAGMLARTLGSAQRLLGLEAIALEGAQALAEACLAFRGESAVGRRSPTAEGVAGHPRLATLVDAIGRLRYQVSPGTALMVVLPGPVALAAALGGGTVLTEEAVEIADEACVAAARAVAEARADAVMVCEHVVPPELVEAAGIALRSVCTTLRYYGVGSAICVGEPGQAEGPLGDGAGPDVVVVPAGSPAPPRQGKGARGLALSAAAFGAEAADRSTSVRKALAAIPGARLVTTAGEVPAAAPPPAVREVLAVLREHI